MADNKERAKVYQRYGGYKWFEYVIERAKANNAIENIESYYEMLKKYSLVRQFWIRDTKTIMENITKLKDSPTMKPREISLKMTSEFGKIYTRKLCQ